MVANAGLLASPGYYSNYYNISQKKKEDAKPPQEGTNTQEKKGAPTVCQKKTYRESSADTTSSTLTPIINQDAYQLARRRTSTDGKVNQLKQESSVSFLALPFTKEKKE